MASFVRFLRKLSMQFDRERFRRELAEELAAHAALKYREHTMAGLAPHEAARRTQLEMGNVTLASEQTADVRTFASLEQLMQDIWYAFRVLRKNLGFSLAAILSLALGIGGSTAVFSILNALLIKPLPFGQPEHLVRITEFFPKALLVHFRQQCRTMDVAAASPGVEFNVTGQGPAFRITGSPVSANLFAVLRSPVQIGRAFEAYEDQPGQNHVAILSHELWTQQFHADPAVVGRRITIDGIDRTIVGVMPAGFAFPSARIQLWLPSSLDPRQQVDYWAGEFTPLIGRLHPGVTMEQARSEVKSLVSGVWQMFPWPMPRHWNANATVIPLQTDLAGDARGRVLMLLCAVGAVLVIACANVAGLLTARGVERSKELAMRAALGAGRSRIVRQLLTESIVLAGLAGAVGFALGVAAIQLFSAVVPSDLPGAARIGIDWNVAAFSVALSVVAGISFGIAPALSASRLNLLGMVRAGGQRGATPASITFRAWLIVGEVALTLVLVIGAAQLIRSLHALSTADPGFQPQRVLAMKISPDAAFCANPAACIAFYERVLGEGRGVPGVADTALANTVPLDGSAPSLPMDVEDHPKTAEFPAPMFWTGAVSPGYLRLMGISLLAGRSFTPADTRDSEPVVLITASTARRFWPGQNVIGKHIKWVSESRWRTIVGVVADVRQYTLDNRAPAGISGGAYLPYAQSVAADGRIPSVMHLIVKTASDAPEAAEEIRRLAVAINPDIPVSPVVRLDTLVGESVSGFRSTAWLFLTFAAVALALATIGIYGLVAYSMTQHAYEIALRMAIGATGRNILRMVLLQSLRPGLLGVSTGLAVALLAVRSFSSLLPDVAPTDPLLYAFVSAFLLAVIILASMVPAWRALRIDPVRVLRAE